MQCQEIKNSSVCKKVRFFSLVLFFNVTIFIISDLNSFFSITFDHPVIVIQTGFHISFPALKSLINVSQCVFYECFHSSLQNLKLS